MISNKGNVEAVLAFHWFVTKFVVDKQTLFNIVVKDIAGNGVGGNFSIVRLVWSGMIKKKQYYVQFLLIMLLKFVLFLNLDS